MSEHNPADGETAELPAPRDPGRYSIALVCLGNIAQIDTPYLTETTSGLTYVVNSFRGWEHSGHVTLMRGERSRLADYASEIL